MESSSEFRSVAWIVPHDGFDLEAISTQLRQAGFHVIACLAGKSSQVTADLRLLPAACFGDSHELRLEYTSDSKPTLILVSSLEQTRAALGFINESDEVGQVAEPVDLLARRLSRLATRSINAEQLHALQHLDPLTGVSGRGQFMGDLIRCLEEMLPGDVKGLMLLDLDHFKGINDRFGHTAGDQVLREVAALVKTEASPDDRIGRLGGDEFVYLFSRYDRRTVEADARKILERIASHPFLLLEQDQSATATVAASAGLVFLQMRSSAEEILRQADMAMYEAKRKGRKHLMLYEQLQESATNQDKDIHLQHFENVARVVTDRVTNQITQMGRRLVEAARRDANQDGLTELNNRRYFDARISREIEIARNHGRALTVALMDLDRFHNVNMMFGWPTGDRVLKRFAQVAADNIRLVDWVARYGGEEFCLVMPDTDLEMGCKVVERIRSSFESSTIESLDQRPVPVTVSIGVAQLTGTVDGAVALIDKASTALLEAKRSGRNRVIAARVA